MPTGREAQEYWKRLITLETQVSALMTFQRWQMGLLSGIILLVMSLWLKR